MKTYASIAKAIDALYKIELAEQDYLEKKSNASLDSKSKNAGSNNYTKYWRDINDWKLLGYNTGWAGGPAWYWCAALQTWCFVKAFGLDGAKKLLLHSPFISCATMYTNAKAKNQIYTSPKVGDIVLYYSASSGYHHTGWVYKVDASYFYTSEGNTSASTTKVVPNGGAVALKKYSIADAKRAGHKFMRPDYSIVVKKEAAKTSSTTTTTVKKEEPKKETTYTISTKKDPLRCRKTATLNGTVIGYFAKGTKVTLVEKTNKSFFKVKGTSTDKKSITGYCSTTYLK